jgi:hypothetical protein
VGRGGGVEGGLVGEPDVVGVHQVPVCELGCPKVDGDFVRRDTRSRSQ